MDNYVRPKEDVTRREVIHGSFATCVEVNALNRSLESVIGKFFPSNHKCRP